MMSVFPAVRAQTLPLAAERAPAVVATEVPGLTDMGVSTNASSVSPRAAGAERDDSGGLPDAPGAAIAPVGGEAADDAEGPQQTKRILGIIPNFRSVSAGVTLPPQTPREKFKTGFEDSFDYSSVIFVAVQAGIAQATKSYPAFHQGAAGYARYYWHTFADQADENLLVESILPTVTHEDSRYYTLGHGGFVKRSVYAASRIAITRKDSGGETVNLSEIVGAGGAAGISTAYYPGQYDTWTKTGQRWLTNLILDGATLYVKEFWPDINRKFSKGGE